MDPATIQEIAKALAEQLYLPSSSAVALGCFGILIAAGIGAFVGSYLLQKAKQFATKEDFEDLKTQLRANTRTVEEVKSEFAQRDWVARERLVLMRQNLEKLLESVHECRESLQQDMDLVYQAKYNQSPEKFSWCRTLAALHFPELLGEVNDYLQACRDMRIFCLSTVARLIEILPEQRGDALSAYNEARTEPFKSVLQRMREVEEKAAELMRDISGAAISPGCDISSIASQSK